MPEPWAVFLDKTGKAALWFMKLVMAALVLDLVSRPEELIGARTNREFTVLGEGAGLCWSPNRLVHVVLCPRGPKELSARGFQGISLDVFCGLA